MEIKHVIAFFLLVLATPLCTALACMSRRARDAMFFMMIAGIVVTERLEVHFFSYWWYRGSTRGIEFSFLDVLAASVLISSVLFPRGGRARLYWPASLGPMLLYSLYAAASVLLISDPKIYGVFELSKILRGILYFLSAALFVQSRRELMLLAAGLSCAVCYEGVLALHEQFDGVYRVTGSLDHANSLSMFLCLVTPPLIPAATCDLPKKLRVLATLAILLASISIILAMSRAGIPIFAFVTLGTAAFCISWRITPKKLAAISLIFICVAGVAIAIWGNLKDRYEVSTLSEEYLDKDAVESRGYFLRVARVIMDDKFLGIGLNNWSYWVSKKYGAELNTPYDDYDALTWDEHNVSDVDYNYAAPAHNLAALTVGELGVPGLVLFGIVWLRWFQIGATFLWRTRRDTVRLFGVGLVFGVGGVFLQSITEWTYRQTHMFLMVHIFVGAMASLYHAKKLAKREPENTVIIDVPQFELAPTQ
jgi:hypothetical protein